MDGVSAWAEERYGYREPGDELYDDVPPWFMDKCRDSRLPATDLGRVMWAHRFSGEGWPRVVWIDADLLIFAPDQFSIETYKRLAFCREIVVFREGEQIVGDRRVNNSISVYGQGNTFLPYYGEACLRRAATVKDQLHSCEVGTILLTGLNQLSPLPLIQEVACFDARMQWGHRARKRALAELVRRSPEAAGSRRQPLPLLLHAGRGLG